MNEIWKDIIGYEGLYEISSLGRIKSNKGFLSIQKAINGYMLAHLWGNNIRKSKLVHRLVGLAFIPNPDMLKEINHLDGNKGNNVYSNLEWTTRSKNQKHSYDVLGRIKPPQPFKEGSGHPLSKSVYCPTLGIRFDSARIAARETGVSQGSISDICNGKRIQKEGLTFNYT